MLTLMRNINFNRVFSPLILRGAAAALLIAAAIISVPHVMEVRATANEVTQTELSLDKALKTVELLTAEESAAYDAILVAEEKRKEAELVASFNRSSMSFFVGLTTTKERNNEKYEEEMSAAADEFNRVVAASDAVRSKLSDAKIHAEAEAGAGALETLTRLHDSTASKSTTIFIISGAFALCAFAALAFSFRSPKTRVQKG